MAAENNELKIDFSDWKSMRDLMDKSDELRVPYFGENEDGEDVLISINKDNIIATTYQSNGWIRENIYWREDGLIEEMFHGRWR